MLSAYATQARNSISPPPPKKKNHIYTAAPTQSMPHINVCPTYTVNTHRQKQSDVECVCNTDQEFDIHPKTKKNNTFTRQPHTQCMPHIFAPHAHTAIYKAVLCAHESQTRNSPFITKYKPCTHKLHHTMHRRQEIYYSSQNLNKAHTRCNTHTLHAAHIYPTCTHRHKQSVVVCVCIINEKCAITSSNKPHLQCNPNALHADTHTHIKINTASHSSTRAAL